MDAERTQHSLGSGADRKADRESGSDFLSGAEAFLSQLKASGVEYLFSNAGTDFPPIIEAFARASTTQLSFPTPLLVSHEAVAMGMAHGFYLVTGRLQAVMVHVNVGLANATMGIINAASDNVPVIVCSGRTPITETGRAGSRTTPIHWGQEMRDQAAMVREIVKWDYELRYGDQAIDVVSRAVSLATSDPPGPVYLSLPREALAEVSTSDVRTRKPVAAELGRPLKDAIEKAAELLANAKFPLVIAQRGTGSGDFEPLSEFVDRYALPTCEFWATRNSLSTSHPMHLGRDPTDWLRGADVVLVMDSMVPWIPDQVAPPSGCKAIAIGSDPLFSRVPMRGYPFDVLLTGSPAEAVRALDEALATHKDLDRAQISERRRGVHARRDAIRQQIRSRIEAGSGSPMSPAWVSHCISQAKAPSAVVFSELACEPAAMTFEKPRTLFTVPQAGGLGWALPAALGAQLADPISEVIACVGDGSYIFSNPVACHHMASAHRLPVLTIVFNNGIWNAVRRATVGMYPDGAAAQANKMPLTSLEPSPDCCGIARAHGAYAERVEQGEELPGALERALEQVRTSRLQALLEVMVSY
ncbi:thiamine pyrophosphate-requiring protein [Bradyrhizobium archetypum]|uniref:Thiamine pyrophosphate-requiring protein n=1 Tax=Bradyrhizobium archetypum TaxID=2721160 RepID=A0A7Y4H382_9BRAD|nr:thiamine pyrophosphate-requiring protein [Bradyrhizobium archetypum]NOJ45912.1 thiamine pyrophosphate-requiring protein [Bradyrhizobium archetypum]